MNLVHRFTLFETLTLWSADMCHFCEMKCWRIECEVKKVYSQIVILGRPFKYNFLPPS